MIRIELGKKYITLSFTPDSVRDEVSAHLSRERGVSKKQGTATLPGNVVVECELEISGGRQLPPPLSDRIGDLNVRAKFFLEGQERNVLLREFSVSSEQVGK